ncbi:hypothetical protein HY449_01795 [Candidatus Pacearchaeota archaeon]|nr:hypothetical protein [Candidatus Pacearchaeota archaeon]
MRKIPLNVEFFAGSLRIIAVFLLRSEDPHLFIPIRAIVDTGSPVTLIGPLDMKRTRISKVQLAKLQGKHKPVNIGGGQIFTIVLEKAKLKFGDFEVEMSVDFPIKGEDNSLQPSLLGIDFLLKTKAKLIFNPSDKEAYFEIEDGAVK